MRSQANSERWAGVPATTSRPFQPAGMRSVKRCAGPSDPLARQPGIGSGGSAATVGAMSRASRAANAGEPNGTARP
jgi:hypothetical protein